MNVCEEILELNEVLRMIEQCKKHDRIDYAIELIKIELNNYTKFSDKYLLEIETLNNILNSTYNIVYNKHGDKYVV